MLSKLGGAIKGVFAGGIIFLLAFPVLFLNEGCAVKAYNAYAEGRGAIKQTKGAKADKVDPQFDGKLVHMTAEAKTDDTVEDDVFKISQNALKLRRKVEMYQWEESERQQTKEDRDKRRPIQYNHDKVWSENFIDSSTFHEAGYDNPPDMKFRSQEWDAENVSFGSFRLSRGLFSRMTDFDSLKVGEDDLKKAENLGTNAVVHDGGFYLADEPNPASPQIGDIRVSFEVVRPQKVSILAKQMGDTFEEYVTSNDYTIELLQSGEVSADKMFATAESNVAMMTWFIRVGGFFMMFIGMSLIFAPLTVLTDVLPIVDQLAELGTAIIAFFIAAACSSITIAVAWVFYRPLLGITMLVIGIGLIVAMVMWAKKKKAASADTTPPMAEGA